MGSHYWLLLIALLLAIEVKNDCRAQSGVVTEDSIWRGCPPLAYLPQTDSITRQATLDSVANYLTGRWELVQISSGWGPNHKPARTVELTINAKKEGIIQENGSEVARFQLTLSRRWNSIWFRINQQGQSIFHIVLSPKAWGLIHICKQKLIISDAKGDGTAFAFRRVLLNAPSNVYPSSNSTALLNYSTWFANARAMIEPASTGQSCSSHQLSLRFETDLPYTEYPATPKEGRLPALNLKQSIHRLRLAKMPLAVGRYDLIQLERCSTNATGTQFELFSGGHLIETYYPQGAWCGWIEITRYDPVNKVVEGFFDFYLLSQTNRLAAFSEGAFNVTISQ